MTTSVLSLPVSIEQIATAVKQMSKAEQEQLLNLVPELRQLTPIPSVRTMAQMKASVQQLQTEVFAIINQQPLPPTAPFLGELTLGQFLDLPEAEKARLWEEWADEDLMELTEREVAPNALPA